MQHEKYKIPPGRTVQALHTSKSLQNITSCAFEQPSLLEHLNTHNYICITYLHVLPYREIFHYSIDTKKPKREKHLKNKSLINAFWAFPNMSIYQYTINYNTIYYTLLYTTIYYYTTI